MPSISSSTSSPGSQPAAVAVLEDAAAADGARADHVAGPQARRVARRRRQELRPRTSASRRCASRCAPRRSRARSRACRGPPAARRATPARARARWRSPCPWPGPRPTDISFTWRSRADQSFMIVKPSMRAVGADHGGQLELVVEHLRCRPAWAPRRRRGTRRRGSRSRRPGSRTRPRGTSRPRPARALRTCSSNAKKSRIEGGWRTSGYGAPHRCTRVESTTSVTVRSTPSTLRIRSSASSRSLRVLGHHVQHRAGLAGHRVRGDHARLVLHRPLDRLARHAAGAVEVHERLGVPAERGRVDRPPCSRGSRRRARAGPRAA